MEYKRPETNARDKNSEYTSLPTISKDENREYKSLVPNTEDKNSAYVNFQGCEVHEISKNKTKDNK